MSNLRNRLLLIAALIIASVAALFPRKVVERRQETAGGPVTYDTVRRVPIKKGLDLNGGMYLALEVDESKQAVVNKSEALDRALTVLRERIDQFGVVEPNVQKVGDDRIIVELPGVEDEQRALAIVEQVAALKFQITDETEALPKALPRLDRILKEKGLIASSETPAAGDTAAKVNPLGNLFVDSAAKASQDSTKRDSTQADTGIFNTANRDGPLSRSLNQGSIPGEYLVAVEDFPAVERYLSLPEIRAALPPGKEVYWGNDTVPMGQTGYRALYVVDARAILTGDKLTNATPTQSPTEGTVVSFQLSNEGGRRFRTETQRNIGNYMAIVLDDKVMGRPPVIQSAIGTQGQITMGGRRFQEAADLALVLKAGALPVPLKVMEIRSIGASLGQDSIDKGMRAGIIAVVLVVLIMVIYYKFSGVLAIAGLLLYVLYTLAVLAGFNAALTLPGLAGFVLSIGIAVDANVLIFERIREELDHGKSVRTAIEEGFKHAMSAIVDSNVSTALTAVVLYQFGSGPVRGFAVTLLAGIAASMVTSIFVVKTFFLLWLQRSRSAQTLSI
jgi:preprotein translocase subunit SecD